MDIEEFKKRLMIEPGSGDPDFVAAKSATLDHARAVKESQAFERMLEGALRLPVPTDAAERVLTRCFDEAGSRRREASTRWRFLAVAASLALAVGLAYLMIRPDPAMDVRTAFVEHFLHPEPMALASDQPVELDRVSRTLEIVGADGSPRSATVTYISRCVIGGVKGVHMVLTDAQQRKTTLMFVPDRQLAQRESFELDGIPVQLFATGAGAAAVFGHGGRLNSALIQELFGGESGALAFSS